MCVSGWCDLDADCIKPDRGRYTIGELNIAGISPCWGCHSPAATGIRGVSLTLPGRLGTIDKRFPCPPGVPFSWPAKTKVFRSR